MESHMSNENSNSHPICKQIIKWSETHTGLLGFVMQTGVQQFKYNHRIAVQLEKPQGKTSKVNPLLRSTANEIISENNTNVNVNANGILIISESNLWVEYLIVHISIFRPSIIDHPTLSLNFNFQLPRLWAPLKKCAR